MVFESSACEHVI